MPCKHFLAVMEHCPEFNWSSFPDSYRSSPYLNLDKDALFGGKKVEVPQYEDPLGNVNDITEDEFENIDMCKYKPPTETTAWEEHHIKV